MPEFCDIVVPVPLDMVFTYRVPADAAPVVGGRVLVSFRQQRMTGIVVELHDRTPSEKQVRIFEQTQILQIDHSFNASTFTARVVTSTLAPPASALAAAMGSLYGPLHGAADQGALEMAQEVGDPKRAADFVALPSASTVAACSADRRIRPSVSPTTRVKSKTRALATQVRCRRHQRRISAVHGSR